MEQNPKINPNQNAVETLEKRLKEAYADQRFSEVKKLADETLAMAPDNHVAKRLLEKMKAVAEKANQPKKPSLMVRLKAWMEKKKADRTAKKALAVEAMKVKTAQKEAEAKAKAMAKKKQEEERRAHADAINKMQDDVKAAFSAGKTEEMEKACAALTALDPGNKIAVEFRKKVENAKKELARKELAKKESEKKELAKKELVAKRALKPGLLARFRAWKKKRSTLRQMKMNFEEEEKKTSPKNVAVSKPAAAVPAKPASAVTMLPKPAVVANAPVARILAAFAKLRAKPALAVKKAPAAAPVAPVAMPTPVIKNIPASVVAEAPAVKAVPAPAIVATPVIPAKPAVPAKDTGGNIFTKMFGKKEAAVEEKKKPSIIDTIVSKTDVKKAEPKKEKPKELTGLPMLRFAAGFLQFTAAFILVTAGFFYAYNIDTQNRVLKWVGVEANYASRLHGASEQLEAKKEGKKTLKKEINQYESGYNNRYEDVIGKIVEKRLNWPDILKKINEVTDSVYERNELSQYVKYDSFSFDAEKGQVRVSGSLSDPLGKNLTKLAELEQAFRNYPRDPQDPDDKTTPYFENVNEFNSLQKSFDQRTKKYKSNFQLSFSLTSVK